MKINWQGVNNFSEKEFADNTGLTWISKELVYKLDTARTIAGVPFNITSACRNSQQNITAGGSPDSSHLTGMAADISAPDSRTRSAILRALIAVGFTRIGVGSDFIHVDVDPGKDQDVIWVY